jgi:nucleoside-diphosphate kinase
VAKCCTWPLATSRDAVRLPLVNRTLVIIKPDGVERGLVGEIIARFEARKLRILAAELRAIDVPTAERHYAEHRGKSFYEPLVAFITRSPSLLMVLEGPGDTEDVWRIVRTMMGATDPVDAAPGTIRGDLATAMKENLIHGSDSIEAALREIAIFFPDLE